jgi:hypothetical protein
MDDPQDEDHRRNQIGPFYNMSGKCFNIFGLALMLTQLVSLETMVSEYVHEAFRP